MAIKVNKEKGTVTIDYRDNSNKRYRETFQGGITLAKKVLNIRKAEIAEGKFFPDLKKQKLTFSEAADKCWELHLSKTKAADKTKYTVKALKNHFGNKPLAKITSEDVQKFYNQRRSESSVATANKDLAILNSIINKVIKFKIYVGVNPCDGVVKEKDNGPRTRYLSGPEIKQVLTLAPERSKTLIAFAIGTGMRRGEIFRLTWNDIDLVNNIIYINESKSGKKREVPIIESLRPILASINPKNGTVFNLSTKQLEYDFKNTLEKAGIEGIRFHDLRHTFASHFMMSGGNQVTLQRILGHSDFKMTQRYAHLSPDYVRQSTLVVNNLIPVLS